MRPAVVVGFAEAHPDDLDDRRPSGPHGACRRAGGGAGTSGDNWKHLLALPMARRSIFVAKWAAGAGLLLVSSVVLPAAVGRMATEILKALRPALRGAPVPHALVTIRVAGSEATTRLTTRQE
jgi:hypothetical protein